MMPPLIVVVGETASGKSALALQLAQQFDGELICADSWTVRRQLDIGTAKPSIEDQAMVPHHLLNIVDPNEDFTAALFKDLANKAITDICQRGKLPIMVGGTGLYVDGVLFDYQFLPAGRPGLRDELEALSITELMSRIEAEGINLGAADVRNKRRLIRLLETGGAEQQKAALRDNTLIIGLQPDRVALKQRITQRVDAMLAAGLGQEAKATADQYGWDCQGLKGIGYYEWRDYYNATQSLAITRDRIISSTIGLSKRQRTWFARNKSIHWFITPVKYIDTDKLVTTFLNN